jgi:predicted phosphodiesterase
MEQSGIVPVHSLTSRCLVLLVVSLVVIGCSSSGLGDVTVSPDATATQFASPSPAATLTRGDAPSPTMTTTQETRPTLTPSPSPMLWIFESELPFGEISYLLPLTILHVTEHTVTLFFELDAPAMGSVYVRSMEGESQIIEKSLSAMQTRHKITIEGLLPGNRYEVRVAIKDEAEHYLQPGFLSRLWGPVQFHTMVEDGSLRFGVIGDASFGDSATSVLVKEMAALNLDFVLHTGDVVDETEMGIDPFDSYAMKFYVPFEPLLTQMPVYKVIGNHDYDEDIRWQGEPFYYYAFPAFADPRFPGQGESARNQYYAFAHGGIQFLMLDSQAFYGVSGREEQNSWLVERLADSNFVTTIPVFHVAPFSSSSVHPGDSLAVQNAWVPLFEEANVQLVFSGHFHQYERLSQARITYIVSGGGSSINYAPGTFLEQSQLFARKPHFVLAEVNWDRIRLIAIGLGGEVIDQVESYFE